MHCFASENQIYTGTVIFGVESLKSLKDQEKFTTENPRRKRPIFVMENIFCRKVGIQSTDEMAFKRTETLREFSICRHQI